MNFTTSRININLTYFSIFKILFNFVLKKNDNNSFLEFLKKKFKNKNILLFGLGRSAFYSILKNLKMKNPSKKKIIISRYNFKEIINIIKHEQLEPVLVDINENTGLMEIEEIKKKIDNETLAVVITHLFSDNNKFIELIKYLKDNEITVIEDNAINFSYKMITKKNEIQPDYSFYSFNKMKSISLIFGGMLIVKNSEDYKKILELKKSFIILSNKMIFKSIFLVLLIKLATSRLVYNLFTKYFFIYSENNNILTIKKLIYPGFFYKDSSDSKQPIQTFNYNFNFILSVVAIQQTKLALNQEEIYFKNSIKFYELLKNNKNLKVFDPKKFSLNLFFEYPILILKNKKDKIYKYLLKNKIVLRNYWYYTYKDDTRFFSKDLEKNLLCLPCHANINDEDIYKIANCINTYNYEE